MVADRPANDYRYFASRGSRIYLGIHWSFDKTEGLTQGERVADYVFARTYRPVR